MNQEIDTKQYIKPIDGNINLLLSVNELLGIARTFKPMSNKLIYQLRQLSDKFYTISNNGESNEVIFTRQEVEQLLHAPLGLLSECYNNNISMNKPFRIELEFDLREKRWVISK